MASKVQGFHGDQVPGGLQTDSPVVRLQVRYRSIKAGGGPAVGKEGKEGRQEKMT